MSTTTPTETLHCPVCDAPGLQPDAREWPSHDPIWTEGRRYLCSGCGSWLVVKVDDGKACLTEEAAAPASPESDTDQFTRGLGTAPSCPGCRKPVTDVPPNEKPKPEAIVEHHDCMFPARGARWTLPAPAERKPVAGWEKSGGVSCLAAGSLRAKVALENWVIVTECDGGLALTDTAAQLAAEDALFAIADAINALRGGR